MLTFVAPNLSITKADGTQVRGPGDTYTYTLTIENEAGGRDATGVQVTDALPDGLAYVSSSDGGSEAAGVVSWPVFDLAAGASTTRTVTVTVDDPLADDITGFLNLAAVTDDGTHGPDPDPDDNTDTDLDTTDAAVDLTITKDDGQQIRTPGETFTYTLDVENLGNQDESGIVVTDTLPAGLTFDSASDGGTESGGVVTWPAFALGGGSSTTRTVTVTVDDPVVAGLDDLVNVADVTSPDDANPLNNSDTDTDVLDAEPDLSIAKDDGETTVVDGDTLTYTLTIVNAGDQGATGVDVEDTLPVGTSFVSASDGGTEAAGVVTWPGFSLASGASTTRTVTVDVDDPLAPGISFLVNTATVGDDGDNGPDPTPEDNTATDTDQVVPDLVLTKDDGIQSRTPGETYTYTITVENVGGDATGVAITDELPDLLTFESASDGGTESGGTVTWPEIDLDSGDSVTRTVTVTLVDPVPFGTTQIVNEAAVVDDGANGADPTPLNNLDEDTDTVDSEVDLAVTKDDGATEREPGDQYTYTLSISNEGDQDAEGAVVTDTLPPGLGFVSASDGGTFAAGVVTWPAFDLAGHGSTSRSVTVAVDDPLAAGIDDVTNTAEVDAPGDTNDDNDAGTDTDVLDAEPDLSIAKDDGETTVVDGDTLTYTLTIVNTGDQGATGVDVEDTLPVGTAFVSASDGGTESSPGVVTWPGFSLASGASTTRTVTVDVDDPLAPGISTLVNTATVGDDGDNGDDPTPEDNTDTDTDQVVPDLVLTKDDGLTVVQPGDTFTYTITVDNVGGDATGVVLTDDLPPLTTFDSASDGGTESGGTVTWPAFDLASGFSANRTVTVTLDDPVPFGTTEIVNDAAVEDDGTHGDDPTPENNVDEDIDTVDSEVDLAVTKDDGATVRQVGDQYTYTISISNVGDQDSEGAVLTDTLPSGLGFVSASDGGTFAAGVVTWPAFDLAGHDATTRTVTVEVDDPLAAGIDDVTNTATVDAPGDDNDSNDSGTDVDTIDAVPDLNITKSDGQDTAVEGESLLYTLSIGNDGDQGATGVLVTDTLPTGTTFVSASNGGTEAGGVVTWPTFDLDAGDSVTRTVTVTVDDPLPEGTLELLNVATVDDDGENGEDPNPEDNEAEDTDGTGSDLSVTKTNGQTTTTPGEELAYTITVANAGPETVTQMVLDETLPTALTDVTFEPEEGTYDATTELWTGIDLAAGEQLDMVVRGTVAADATGSLINSVVVDDPDHADPTPSDNSAVDEDTLAPEANLLIVKDADATSIRPGGEVTYTLAVTNEGPSAAPDVVVEDVLPEELEYVSAVAADWSVDVDGNHLTFTYDGLFLPGETSTIEIVTRVVATSGEIANTASVSSSIAETTMADNADAAVLEIIVDPDDAFDLRDFDDDSFFDELAFTGSPTQLLVLTGLATLGAGVGLLAFGRRRRHRTT